MRLKTLDLIAAGGVVVLNVVWTLLPIHVPVIGIILALPLVFVLPGYTLTEALFHKRTLNAADRLLFSLGLSLAVDVLSGFLLNVLPLGLQPVSWAVLLGLLTAVFSLVAAYRRRGAVGKGTRTLKFRLTLYEGIVFGLAVIIAVLSVLYAVIGAEQQRYPGFTQLWMLPAAQTGKSCAVRLGVQSFEATPQTYRVTMAVNGTQVNTWSPVILAPEQEWEQFVPITPGSTNPVSIEVLLYRSENPRTAYREVHLTFHNPGGGGSNLCASS
jgi:uncharacterized membrane protein